MPRERVVEAHLAKRATELGGMVRKVVWPGRRGAPDRALFFPAGVLYWVELKTVGGKLSPSQRREHVRLRNMGQVVLVLWTIAQVDEFIKELGPVLAAADEIQDTIRSITH